MTRFEHGVLTIAIDDVLLVTWRVYGEVAEVVWRGSAPFPLNHKAETPDAVRAMDDEVAQLGADGWEMFQVNDTDSPFQHRYFRRRVGD